MSPSRSTRKTARRKVEVGVIMGSQSDWETLKHAATTLKSLGIAFETRIISAHRTPKRLFAYAYSARRRGLKAIIAGAGGAAHLAGVTAALTLLPVFGVPVESKTLKGLDSLLSIAQMPPGIPVGTLAIGRAGAINAALLAAAVLALSDARVRAKLDGWRAAQAAAIPRRPKDEPATPSRGRRRSKKSRPGPSR